MLISAREWRKRHLVVAGSESEESPGEVKVPTLLKEKMGRKVYVRWYVPNWWLRPGELQYPFRLPLWRSDMRWGGSVSGWQVAFIGHIDDCPRDFESTARHELLIEKRGWIVWLASLCIVQKKPDGKTAASWRWTVPMQMVLPLMLDEHKEHAIFPVPYFNPRLLEEDGWGERALAA